MLKRKKETVKDATKPINGMCNTQQTINFNSSICNASITTPQNSWMDAWMGVNLTTSPASNCHIEVMHDLK